MTGSEIRKIFLDFFEKHQHRVIRSSSLVPKDDPTLLFTNAGMVQFKRTFLGEEKRDYVRAATSQKCVRAGGKHNDLENVGYTARHHTFFEMLGNFSFGDYFKEKAINFAWDLLTNGYGFPADKLWVSVYLDDDEAADLWNKNIGVPEDRIVRFGEEDNFWAMGDTGPCGPCSEIHIDRGAAHGCGKPDCKLGCECDRFLEIWNLVFMQFNRNAAGELTPLPKPSIDTGMGLERIISIIQDVPTNFDIDLMTPIIRRVEELSEKRLGESVGGDIAMKVITDHSRAAAFLVCDGVLPSNEGRGYVLRRIMRRAIRYGRNIGLTKPFLHDTSNVVIDTMESAYPELSEARSFITNVIREEENRFSKTLDTGLRLLSDTLENMKAGGRNVVPGDIIFKLYDTYGFPVDIVRDVVRDKDMTLDMEGFEKNMDRQREQSRSVVSFSEIGDAYKKLTTKGFVPEFLGYETIESEADVVLIVREKAEVMEASSGDTIEIVTNRTPFYGESGGQVGDKGTISNNDGLLIEIFDTIKDPTGMTIHRGSIVSGTIKSNDRVLMKVDRSERESTALNHTATHILHAALRAILGDHVKQAGSMVAPNHLRFDFTHFSRIEPETLEQVEQFVNEKIRLNVPVETREMDSEEAFKSGATALFEEKYGDRVRVVSLDTFSKELCGGTHTTRTGNIGAFKILSESSVGAGIRRIEAQTGKAALLSIQETASLMRKISGLLREKPAGVPDKIQALLEELKKREKEIEQIKSKLASASIDGSLKEVETINGTKVIIREVSVDSPAALRDLADRFKDHLQSGIVVLGTVTGEKVLLIVSVSKDLTKRYHAGNIVKQAAAVVGGGGGGRPDMAQAGGTRTDQLGEALKKAAEVIQEM